MDDAATPGFFNINHNVCVRLTDYGREVHKQNHVNLYARYEALANARNIHLPKDWSPTDYRPPTEESDGWSEWQAWVLMQEFGHVIGNGMKVPFEPPIFIGSLRQLREAQAADPSTAPAPEGKTDE